MAKHYLNCDKTHFRDFVKGTKTFYLRLNDQDYHVGDHLVLNESLGSLGSNLTAYTGEVLTLRVTHILLGHPGLAKGYVVMSIEVIPKDMPNEEWSVVGVAIIVALLIGAMNIITWAGRGLLFIWSLLS